tara:strand:+ start:663 stop:854 length:192 start_codon:yes stop_codon:yes gene_type:complete
MTKEQITKEQILDKLYQAKDYASNSMNVAQQVSELASEVETQAIETYDNLCDAINMVEELKDE